MSNAISFYVDCLIVEALSQEHLTKQAEGGMIMALIDKVKDYANAHIEQNNKVSSVLTILAPGTISIMFKAMGLGWLGALLGLAITVFHIDVGGMLTSIYNSVKNMLSSGQPISSNQIDSAIQGAAQDTYKPVTQQEADALAQKMQTTSIDQILQDARFVKLSMIQYQAGTISKTAGLLDILNSRKAKTSSILSRVIGWVFKIVLASAGLMVAGDIVNKLVGRPNALDNTLQNGKPVAQPSAMSGPTSTQTKFKVNPSYRVENYNVGDSPWVVQTSNNSQSIGDMIVGFAKDVYNGLDGKEDIIRQTTNFQEIQDKIAWYNHTAEGGPIVYIPTMFNSKKQLVDYFIDEVAAKST